MLRNILILALTLTTVFISCNSNDEIVQAQEVKQPTLKELYNDFVNQTNLYLTTVLENRNTATYSTICSDAIGDGIRLTVTF